jgi:hypothetical protein
MLSDLAHRIADTYGVFSIMFAMCLHFAIVQLQDDAPSKSHFFSNLVFWHNKSRVVDFGDLNKTQRERKHDFILLQHATLIRLNWATHVSAKDYAEGVQDLLLDKITQEQKDVIGKMFDDQDKTHADLMIPEPFGDDVALSRLDECFCISDWDVCYEAARTTRRLKAPSALIAPDC